MTAEDTRSAPSRSGRAWAVALLVLGAATFGLLLAAVSADGAWVARDETLLTWFVDHRSPVATAVLGAITTAFGPCLLPVVVLVGCLLWAWRGRRWSEPLLLAGAMVVSTALSQLLKVLVGRPRPAPETMVVPGLETTASFPSGHSIGVATLALVGGYLWWRARPTRTVAVVAGITAPVVIAVVALSRLYLGYHFLTDVLAGIALGLVVLGAVVLLRPPGRAPAPTAAGSPRAGA